MEEGAFKVIEELLRADSEIKYPESRHVRYKLEAYSNAVIIESSRSVYFWMKDQ